MSSEINTPVAPAIPPPPSYILLGLGPLWPRDTKMEAIPELIRLAADAGAWDRHWIMNSSLGSYHMYYAIHKDSPHLDRCLQGLPPLPKQEGTPATHHEF